MDINPKTLSDEKLHFLCVRFGTQSLQARQKFIGLLPEVYRRKLYQKKGFSSIFEYAAKLAGVSQEQVRRALNLDKKFEDKPILKSMLENGEISINKLSRIASIATIDNQELLAKQAKLLPQSALETLVRDEKTLSRVDMYNIGERADEQQNGFQKLLFDDKSVRAHRIIQQLNISEEVALKLLELQNKGIDINQLLLEFFEKRELEVAQEKEKLSAEIHRQPQPKVSRYIPAKIKKLLQKEYGTKCSIPQCRKEAEEIHHTQRFALGKNHNPYFLAPLCRSHHLIAHSIDSKFHEHAAMSEIR